MPNYKNKITPSKAVDNAMAEAKAKLGAAIDKGKVLNCGDDDDYVYTDEEASLNNLWTAKTFKHDGVVYEARKINASSGDVKFDLRFANGSGPSVFNYHVPFKKDTSAEDAADKKSAEDKKVAAAFKLELERKEKEAKEKAAADAEAKKAAAKLEEKRTQALATDWKKANLKDKDKAAWVKAWLEKNKNRKF